MRLTFRFKHFAAITGFVFLTGALHSHAQSLVISSPESRRMTSSDIVKLVDATFPTYDQAQLEKRLTDAGATLQARADRVAVRSLAGIERVMGFTPTTSRTWEVDTEVAYYRVNASKGKSYAQHKRYDFTSLSRDRFSALEPKIRTLQQTFLGTLGLPSDEVMKLSFRKILVQSLNESSTNNSDGTPTTVRRGLTLGYRGFAGFPIEGSVARISSFDTSRIENFSLSWPRFSLHPDATRVILAGKDVIKRNIVAQIQRHSIQGQTLNVVMGVVFRPGLTTDGKLVHVPAMKVVVTPQPREMGGVVTEGGMEFFADVLLNQPALQSTDVADSDLTN